MKYKKFFKIGLIFITLNNPINLVNAKEINNIEKSHNKENTVLPIQKYEDKQNFTSKITLRNFAFLSLGIAGLGVAGITYFFIQISNAGKPIKRNIKQQNNHDFLQACSKGDLEKVKYLLNEKSADISSEKNLAIQRACVFNHLEVVKYLLTSSELKKHSDIHANDDYSFKSAYENKNLDIIQYLIFDYQINKSKEIKNFIKDNNELTQMFDKRDLNNQLNQEFKGNDIVKKRHKV